MTKARVHTREQISAFLTELEKQTDRGAALIAAAVLDEILEMLITARLLTCRFFSPTSWSRKSTWGYRWISSKRRFFVNRGMSISA